MSAKTSPNPPIEDSVRLYYLNARGEPVGPFGTSDLPWQTLPGDTLVAEAGSDAWLPLSSLLSAPDTGEDPAPIENHKTPSTTIFYLAKASYAVFVWVFLWATLRRPDYLDAGAFSAIYYILLLVSISLLLQLHAECWKALPQQFRWTSPAKASWLLLVPLLNIFWAFKSWPKLSEGLDSWQRSVLGRVKISTRVPALAFATGWALYPLTGLVAYLPYGLQIFTAIKFLIFLSLYNRIEKIFRLVVGAK